MISEKALVTDGTTTIYSVGFEIISEDHCNVLLGTVLQSSDTYDVINNAVVFHTAPTTGQDLMIRVGTTESDLAAAPTDIGICATNITSINSVATNIANINAVNANSTDVTTVATDIANVNTVAGNTTNINAAVANATNINAVVADASDIGTVATNIASVNTVAGVSADVTTVATNIAKVSTVATDIAKVIKVADDLSEAISEVETVANDLNEAVSEIDTVAASITNVDTVGTNITNVNTVADDITNVNTVADNIAAINNFIATYLGPKASDPLLDNNGDALTAGDLYFNSVNNKLRIYSTTLGWMDAAITAGDFVVKTGDTMTGALTAPDFIGNLNGAVRFTAKNAEGTGITKGQVVYISGISGEVPTVGLADANDSAKMPGFGLVAEDANNNASVEIVSFGSLKDTKTDYTGWSLGDTLYVSTTAGTLTNSAPTGESSLIQNIGKVQRVHATAGIIKAGGAGRSNATPNLNEGNVFIGNASNQAVSVALSTVALSPTGDGSGLTGIDALPSQATHAGKYLTTDATTASWATLDTDANSTTKGLYEHANTIAANYTIATGNNALTAGPITINTGVSVTVPTGSTWVVA